jgi:hypothetical protein
MKLLLERLRTYDALDLLLCWTRIASACGGRVPQLLNAGKIIEALRCGDYLGVPRELHRAQREADARSVNTFKPAIGAEPIDYSMDSIGQLFMLRYEIDLVERPLTVTGINLHALTAAAGAAVMFDVMCSEIYIEVDESGFAGSELTSIPREAVKTAASVLKAISAGSLSIDEAIDVDRVDSKLCERLQRICMQPSIGPLLSLVMEGSVELRSDRGQMRRSSTAERLKAECEDRSSAYLLACDSETESVITCDQCPSLVTPERFDEATAALAELEAADPTLRGSIYLASWNEEKELSLKRIGTVQ